MSRCGSEAARRALHLGGIMKRCKHRGMSMRDQLGMPTSVTDPLCFCDLIDLRSRLESIMLLTLPPGTETLFAEPRERGRDECRDTPMNRVFWGECVDGEITRRRDASLRHRGDRLNRSLTWAQLEAVLFAVEMHGRCIDAAEAYVKDARASPISTATLKRMIRPIVVKERRHNKTMRRAVQSVSTRARMLWVKVRWAVRMHHIAHRLWEYKHGERAARHDVESHPALLRDLAAP